MIIELKLQSLLAEKNISQRLLSKETGVRLATINNMCKNEIKHIPIDNLAKICEFLNCEITDILELVKEPTN